MNAIIVLIGASLFVAICFLIGFIWCVKSGQYEDKFTPAVRILFDDSEVKEEKNKDTVKLNSKSL